MERTLNQTQKVLLELLEVFIGICEEYDLTYYLVAGSALGAVKYQGFIPWDDDVDVAMPREDYERFLQLAPAKLPQWCFLQNYKTDPAFPHVFTKLRNSNTTFIERGMAKLPINHGMYLDIFQMDGYPTQAKEIRKLELQKKILAWKQYCALDGSKNWKVRLRRPFMRLLGYHKRTARTLAQLDRLIGQYSLEDSELWCCHGNRQGKLEYAPRWHYGKGVTATFEGLTVRVPEQFDPYLTRKYGNWREELPSEQQKSHHQCLVCDAKRPYTEYTNH